MGHNIVSLFYHCVRGTSNLQRAEKTVFLLKFLAVLQRSSTEVTHGDTFLKGGKAFPVHREAIP